MARNTWDSNRDNDSTTFRRGDDRTIDYGRGGDSRNGNQYRNSQWSNDQDIDRSRNSWASDYGMDRNYERSGMDRNYERSGMDRNYEKSGMDRNYENKDSQRSSLGSSYDSYNSDFSTWGQTWGQHSGKGPKGYRRSDERIREDASEALERHAHIDASEIEIDVKEGIVTLKGHVEERRIKRMAEDAVAHLSGVKDVRNELSIDQSLFQQAKEALFGSNDSQSPNASGAKMQKSKH